MQKISQNSSVTSKSPENKNEPFHSPWMFIFGAVSAGIIGVRFFPVSLAYLCFMVPVLIAISLGVRHRRWTGFFLFLLFVHVGGLMAGVSAFHGKEDIYRTGKYYQYKTVRVRGKFISDVLHQDQRFSKYVGTLRLKEIHAPWGWERVSGKIRVEIFQEKKFSYGDVVELEGRLHRPFSIAGDSHFSYRNYLANKNIHYVFSVKKSASTELLQKGQGFFLFARIYDLRHALDKRLKAYLTPREAGVMSAMLLGDRSHLAKDIRALFVRTGTAHVLAISGLHIGILTGLLIMFVRFLPVQRSRQYILAVLVLLVYMILTGMRASVVRASLMAVIFLLGMLWERRSWGLNSLFFTGCLLLAFEPFVLFDIGFQLSFTCVLFILLGASGLGHFFRRYLPAWLADALSVSVCAWLGSLGWIAYYFGMVTPISLLANLVIIPLMGPVLLFGLGFFLTVFGVPVVGYYFSLCLKVSLNALVAAVYVFDQCPVSHYYVTGISAWYLIIYYTTLLAVLATGIRASLIDKHSQLC